MGAVLPERGVKVNASTYCEAVERRHTRRELRDEEITGLISALLERNKRPSPAYRKPSPTQPVGGGLALGRFMTAPGHFRPP